MENPFDVVFWVWPEPGDWNKTPDPEGDEGFPVWAPERPDEWDDMNVKNFIGSPLVHSLPDETSINSFESLFAPFGLIGGRLEFTNDFKSGGPVAVSGFATLEGAKDDRASWAQVNSLFSLVLGALKNMTVKQGEAGQGLIVTQGSLSEVVLDCPVALHDGAGLVVEQTLLNNIIGMLADDCTIVLDPTDGLTIGEGGRVRGHGRVIGSGWWDQGRLDNAGTISADVDGHTLLIAGHEKHNSGTLEGVGGGTLILRQKFVCAPSTLIRAETGTVVVDNGQLTGEMHTTGTGLTFSSHPSNGMWDAVVHGPITLGEGGFVQVTNVLLEGAATLNEQGDPRTDRIQVNADLTVGQGGAIVGCGVVRGGGLRGEGRVVNLGLIRADRAGRVLHFGEGPLENHKTLEARGGGTLMLTGHVIFSDDSLVVADTGTVLVHCGYLRGTTTTTGTGLTFSGHPYNSLWDAVINGPVTMGEGGFVQLSNVVFNGPVKLNESGDPAYDQLAVNTVITVGETGSIEGCGKVYGNGDIWGNGKTINHGVINSNVGGEILHIGAAPLENHGTLMAEAGGTILLTGRLNGFEGSRVVCDQPREAGEIVMNHALVTGKMKTVGSGFTFNGHPYNSLYSAEIDGPFSLGEGGFVQVGNVSVTGMVEFHPAGDARISIYSESEQARLALGPQGGLHGCGLVQGGLLVNPGHVLADVPGKRLRLMNTVENAGAIKVANGSEVSLGGQLVGAAGSVIEAAGGLFVVENGDVTGTMEATGTGLTFRGWQMRNTLRNAHIDGRATVEPHGYMCVGNSTVTGMVEMVGPDSILRVPGDYGPNVFVLGGGLRGFGVVDGGGVLENRGEVSAEGAGRVLDFRGVTIRNKQMVGVRGGATLRLNAWLEGSEGSTIQVDEGAKFLVENGAITGKMKTTGTGPTFNGWLYNLLRLATIDGPCEVAETGLMNTYASTVNGFIKLNGPNSVLRLYDDPATSILTLGPDGGVRGGGVIDGGGTVDNRGTISADEGPIRFNIVRTLNRGEIAARNGNTVRLDHCVLEGVDGSLIQVDEGSTFLVEWATVTGRMRTTGTGLTFTWAYNHVIDAVIDGPVTIPDVAQMSNSDVTVNGNINLGGVQAYAGIHGGRRLKLGAGHDLRGFGIVNGDGVLENWGRVIADVPGQTLFVRCAAAENHGILTAIPNATLEVSCPVMQNGTLDVPAGSTVRLNHGLTQSLGEVVVNGTLDIPGWSLTLQGGTLDGAGTINGPVVLEGGRLGSGAAGLLSVHGDYTQGAGATLGVVLGGEAPGASDERLHVTQRATLGGTLLVGVPAGFHPEDGSAYTILRYGSRVGAFDQVVVQDPSGSAQGYSFDVIYNGQDVQLKAVASQAVSAAVVSNSESVAASGESAPPAV